MYQRRVRDSERPPPAAESMQGVPPGPQTTPLPPPGVSRAPLGPPGPGPNISSFLVPFFARFGSPKMNPKMLENRAPKTLLEPGCRWKLVSEPFLVLFGTPRDPENHALAVARCYFC